MPVIEMMEIICETKLSKLF